MKAVVVVLFALAAVAAALPTGPADRKPVPVPKEDDLKGAEAVYVASPYSALPAYSTYSAVPAYSTYSAYSALPAAVNYGYAAAPVAYAYYR